MLRVSLYEKHLLHFTSPFHYCVLLITDREICSSLEDVLVFFTGADRVPPLGFPHTPSLHFLDDTAMFPTASTCSLVLCLPTRYSTYDAFKDAMIEALTCNGGLDGGP